MRCSCRRGGWVVAIACASTLFAAPARAQSDRAACESAHLEAQELTQASKLTEARARLVRCAAKNCPGPIQVDCAGWLEDVNRDIPTAILAARTAGGAELIEVVVKRDGKVVTERLDGKPIELDPGPYTFRFEKPGSAAVDVDFVAQAGGKNRVVQATFPDSAPKTEPSRSTPVAFWVLAGVGTAALASFGYFAWRGQSDYDELERDCSPGCDPDDSDAVKTKFLIADVSLGVAVVAYAGAAYFYFSAPRTRLGLVPFRGGGYATLGQSF